MSLVLASALGAATETGRPVLRAFTPRSYGADAQNLCAVQDADGLMYFGNTNGVLTFDGATWRVIRTGYSENIRGLALGDDGNIYVGGVRQIGFLRPTETGREYVSLTGQLPAGDHDFGVFWRVVAHRGAVYFATRREILVWRGGAFTLLPVENASNETVELFAAGDDLFVTAPNCPLQRVRNGKLEVVSDAAFFRDKTICLLEREADGGLLLATVHHGLFRWRDGQATPVATEVDALLRTPGLVRARRLHDGSLVLILMNQRGTVLVARDGRFLWRTDESAGLPSQVAFDAAEDREGGLWLCLADGLARLEWPSGFSLFDRAQGLPGHGWSMVRHDGTFYFGTDEGLFRLAPGDAATGNARFENVMKGRAAALLSDARGLIVSSDGALLNVGPRGPEKFLTLKKPVLVMLRSTRDPERVWLAGSDEVRSIRRVENAWRDEGAIAGLPGTRTLVETADGALWTATLAGGAYRVRFGAPTANEPRGPAEIASFDPGTHGLSPKHNTMRVYAWGGQVVLAQGGMGLWLFDAANETFAPLPQTTNQVEEPKKLALFLSATQPDHLWVQRDTNLPRELAIFRVPRTGPPQALPHAFVDAAHFARVLLEEPKPDGNVLWVAGNDALLRVETARAFAPAPPLRVLVRAAGVREGQRLGPERRTLAFESVAPLFRAGGGAEYQTRLVGFENGWSEWSEERKRVFTNLGPGAYRFEARARDPDGNVSAVATRAFTIAPPWWRTWWALGLFSVSGIGGVAGVTRWFANRALRRRVALLEAQSAVERERLRLARDLHDEVGSGLGRVILFAGEAERAEGDAAKVGTALARVREAAQELVQHAREIVWAVSPQHDALASVIERLGDYAQDTLRSAGIACAVDAPSPEKIPPVALGSEARHSLFLAVKEAVHNCVKYSEAKTAEFRLRIVGDDFEIVLRDHGRGFAPNERRGSGHGTQNIVARAEALGGQAEIASEVGQGTTVTLRVPLPRNS